LSLVVSKERGHGIRYSITGVSIQPPTIAVAKRPLRVYLRHQSHIARLRGWRRKGPAPKALAVTLHENRLADIARLTQLIEPEAHALGFELVRVRMMTSEAGDGGMALQIMAEDPATGQLVLDQCAELSRRVSAVIDAAEEAGEELVEGAYHLEVSSPGIDRPLTRAKDYANWAGHEAKISLAKGAEGQRNFRGNLVGIEGDQVTIDDRSAGRVTLPLEQIHSAKLVLTDALIAATRPIDMTGAEQVLGGADEILETEEE
jgi:ribosome maturation factor RimP